MPQAHGAWDACAHVAGPSTHATPAVPCWHQHRFEQTSPSPARRGFEQCWVAGGNHLLQLPCRRGDIKINQGQIRAVRHMHGRTAVKAACTRAPRGSQAQPGWLGQPLTDRGAGRTSRARMMCAFSASTPGLPPLPLHTIPPAQATSRSPQMTHEQDTVSQLQPLPAPKRARPFVQCPYNAGWIVLLYHPMQDRHSAAHDYTRLTTTWNGQTADGEGMGQDPWAGLPRHTGAGVGSGVTLTACPGAIFPPGSCIDERRPPTAQLAAWVSVE